MIDSAGRRLPAGVLLALLCWAPAGVRAQGLPPEWAVRSQLEALIAQVRRLSPILSGVRPQEWISKGAPESYVAQSKSVASELDYLVRAAQELSKEPQKLSKALEVLFRMESLEAMVSSLEQGVRKYQNPALADLVQASLTADNVHRQKLRQYIVQLARQQEQELKIMNEEAQRCRGQLSRQPPRQGTARP